MQETEQETEQYKKSIDQLQAMRREIERQLRASQAAEDARKAAEAANQQQMASNPNKGK